MIAMSPSPQFYDHQRERYRVALFRAALMKQELEEMADRPTFENGRRILKAYVLASKFVEYFTMMARATEDHLRRRPIEMGPPVDRRVLQAFYACPICSGTPHVAELRWDDSGPERELPMRLLIEANLIIHLRHLHPELQFDQERLSFR